MTADARTVAAIRFGYGLRPGEAGPDDPQGLLAQLRGRDAGAAPDFPDLPSLLAVLQSRREASRAMREGAADADAKNDAARMILKSARDPLFERRIIAPVMSPQGFRERLVSFWADHFTVIARGPQLTILTPHQIETAIRPNVAGSFADLLIAAVLHPAMLIFLNQNESIGPTSRASRDGTRGLNENLAREILELHTLGVDGPYGQADVRELAEILTGHTVSLDEGPVFRPGWAEPGADRLLGRSYGGDRPDAGDAIRALRDLALHPATARHVSGKLVAHFVRDDPDPGHVEGVAAAWERTGGELTAVYAALLDHPAAWEARFRKARQPHDFLVALLRAFDAGRSGPFADLGAVAPRAVRHLARMGQKLLEPAGPNGWPEEEGAWITPQGLAARVEVVRDYATRAEREVDPRRFVAAALGPAATEPLRFAVAAAEVRWEGIALALLSPEFNRR